MTDWAEGFAGELRPGRRPVVLSIDLMRAYFEPGSPLCLPDRACLEAAVEIVSAARPARVPVIHTVVTYAANALDGGLFVRKVPALRLLAGDAPLGRTMPEVQPRADELVIAKQYASAFFGTSLASTLGAMRADTVVIVGVSTSGCVRASAVDALQHGFVPIVVADAVGDRDAAVHNSSLYDLQAKYAQVVDLAAARAAIGSASAGSPDS